MAFCSFVIIAVFTLNLCLSGCKQKPVTPKPDKTQLQYTLYREIFKSYRHTPVQNVILRMDSFLNSYPEDARGWTFYGRLMYDIDSLDKSIAAYKNAIYHNPRFSEGYAGAGSVYHVLHEQDSALFYLQKAVDLNDSSAYTFLNLSMLCQLKNKTDECAQYAQKAFQLADSSAAVCSGLSYIFKQQHKEAQSAEMYLLAMKLGLTDTVGMQQVLQGTMPIQTFFRNNGY